MCDPTDLIWREGTPFEAVTGRTVFIDCLLAEVLRGFPQQMPETLCSALGGISLSSLLS